MAIEDDFIAFCFDEACAYIERQLMEKDGPRPKWRVDRVEAKKDNNEDVIAQLQGMK